MHYTEIHRQINDHLHYANENDANILYKLNTPTQQLYVKKKRYVTMPI